MLFNSGQFLIFLPVVIVLYFLFPHRFRWIFLLAASYFFYMAWKLEYIALILASTVADYYIAREIAKRKAIACQSGQEGAKQQRKGGKYHQKVAKILLWVSILINLSILFCFKYLNFFTKSVVQLAELAGGGFSPPVLDVLLP